MVIGNGAAEALFPGGAQAVGKEVMMGGKPYEIIGVLEKRKGMLGADESDNTVLIPFRTLRKVVPRSEWMLLVIRAHSGQLKQALDQVEDILRRQRAVKYDDKNNFDLQTADKFIGAAHGFRHALRHRQHETDGKRQWANREYP